MTTQIMVRIEPELKNKVDRLARSEGKTVSTVVRELLADYVNERDIGDTIDSLWDRIGEILTSQGVTQSQIPKIIRAVRKK
jgi:predicted transcriptional regulator